MNKVDKMKNNSLSGNKGVKKEHKMNISREEYLRRMKIYIGTTAMAVAFTIGGGKLLADKIKDTATINTTRYEYYNGLINGHKENDYKDKNWHPTDEGGHYWYDEGSIAQDLEALNENEKYGYEFDVGVSSLIDHIGENEVNKVLRYTEYGGLDEYLDAKGFKDTDELKKEINKEIIIKSNIDKKQKELDEMRNNSIEENNIALEANNEGYGGK